MQMCHVPYSNQSSSTRAKHAHEAEVPLHSTSASLTSASFRISDLICVSRVRDEKVWPVAQTLGDRHDIGTAHHGHQVADPETRGPVTLPIHDLPWSILESNRDVLSQR